MYHVMVMRGCCVAKSAVYEFWSYRNRTLPEHECRGGVTDWLTAGEGRYSWVSVGPRWEARACVLVAQGPDVVEGEGGHAATTKSCGKLDRPPAISIKQLYNRVLPLSPYPSINQLVLYSIARPSTLAIQLDHHPTSTCKRIDQEEAGPEVLAIIRITTTHPPQSWE